MGNGKYVFYWAEVIACRCVTLNKSPIRIGCSLKVHFLVVILFSSTCIISCLSKLDSKQ